VNRYRFRRKACGGAAGADGMITSMRARKKTRTYRIVLGLALE
jgi:hypothetical protein